MKAPNITETQEMVSTVGLYHRAQHRINFTPPPAPRLAAIKCRKSEIMYVTFDPKTLGVRRWNEGALVMLNAAVLTYDCSTNLPTRLRASPAQTPPKHAVYVFPGRRASRQPLPLSPPIRKARGRREGNCRVAEATTRPRGQASSARETWHDTLAVGPSPGAMSTSRRITCM